MRSKSAQFVYLGFSVFAVFVAARAQTPSVSPTPTPAPQSSDIFIVDLKNKEGHLKFGQPMKITASVGYNNQPSFLPNGRAVLYTSIRGKQADIYRYEIHSGATTQVTNRPETQLSPTMMLDGKNISVVRDGGDRMPVLWQVT